MGDIPLHVVFVEARIKKGDKFLLAKRSLKDDQAAGKRSIPGGKVEMDVEYDIIEKTLQREVMEEVGVVVDNPKFIGTKSFIRSSGHHVIGISFIVDYVSGEAMPLEDHDEVRWVDIEEMEKLLSDDHRKETINKLKKI